MLTKTQEKILCFLVGNLDAKLTIRGLARRLKLSYPLIYNNLINLEKQGIIRKQSIPPAQVIGLHESVPMDILVEVEVKRRVEFLHKHGWIKVLLNDVLDNTQNIFFILLLFGSYAKGKETPKSDIDLLFIVQNKEDINMMESALKRAYTKVKKNSVICDIADFKEMIINPDKLTVGNEARKNHIVLYGIEEYYQLIKRA